MYFFASSQEIQSNEAQELLTYLHNILYSIDDIGRGGNPRSFEKPPQVAVSQNIILKSGVVRAVVSFFKDSIFWPD